MLDLIAAKNAPDVPNDEVIREGERNSRLFELACSLFREGQAHGDVLQTVIKTNAEKCAPPLPQSDIYDLVSRVAQSTDLELVAEKEKVALRWFELDAQELLSDMQINRLTDTQLGWRIRLLGYAWLNHGKLPDDPDELAGMARAFSKARFKKEWHLALYDFLEVRDCGDSYLINRKLAAKHAKSSAIWNKRRSAAQASAERRAQDRAEKEEVAS